MMTASPQTTLLTEDLNSLFILTTRLYLVLGGLALSDTGGKDR